MGKKLKQFARFSLMKMKREDDDLTSFISSFIFIGNVRSNEKRDFFCRQAKIFATLDVSRIFVRKNTCPLSLYFGRFCHHDDEDDVGERKE